MTKRTGRAAGLTAFLLFPLVAGAEPIAIRGATVHPISAPAFANGVVIVEGSRIVEVGRADDVEIPAGATIVEADGFDLWPGLVDAMSHLGLAKIGSGRGTESGQMNPNARAEVAINVSSPHFEVTRSNGTLLAASVPRGSLVPGTAAAIALDGWTWEELVRKAPLALVIEWPAMGPTGFEGRFWDRPPPPDWEERVARLDEMLAEAQAYERARQGSPVLRETDVRWESLRSVVRGETPVWIRASHLTQIREAIAWTERHGLRMVLVDGDSRVTGDAWRIADELAARSIPVIVQTTRHPARAYEPYDTAYTAPAVLEEHGVSLAFGSWDSAHARNLPQEIARAVAFGLPREAAERAATLGGAELLGVDEHYGSLEPGKSATMILVEGDLLETRMRVARAWIDGRELDLEDPHKRLWKKWSARPFPESPQAQAMR